MSPCLLMRSRGAGASLPSWMSRLAGSLAALGVVALLGPLCGCDAGQQAFAGGGGAEGHTAGGAAGSGATGNAGVAGGLANGGQVNGNGGNAGTAGVSAGGTAGTTSLTCDETAGDGLVANFAPEPDPAAAPRQYFALHLRTAAGDPVRGATVRTVGKVVYVSDDGGNVAFDEPGQVDMPVFFHVEHPGFEVPADGFGYHGAALTVTAGGTGEIVMSPTTGELGPAQGDLATRLLAEHIPSSAQCTAIRAVDASNGRGVPLVRLRAFGEEYWSDSQGFIAYCNPDHQNASVEFDVMSHGYDPNGGTAVTISTEPGTSVVLEMARRLAAERLYRLTGSGVYRDSVILGLTTPTAQPVLNGNVMGQDTVDATLYKGKLFWLWQDTDRVAYPLGNFRGTCATSELPGNGGLPASQGVDFSYFVEESGFAKPMSEDFEPGGMPVWMAGLVSVPDVAGEERLFAGYAKVGSDFTAAETGLMQFNDDSEQFERVRSDFNDYAANNPGFVRPDGYATKFTSSDGEYVYYPGRLRIPAVAEAMSDTSRYEQFTPYAENGSTELVQLASGDLDYAFRAGGRAITSDALTTAGIPPSQDLDGHTRVLSTGASVALIQTHSVFSVYRRRFLRQAQELGAWGELYHAEADTPMGPWVYAEKVITHDAYTFYNPAPHPEFIEGGGRYAFFEGTYTTFLQTTQPTPRYDYNQILYRSDLEDERVILPIPIYDLSTISETAAVGTFVSKRDLRPGAAKLAAPFLAYDRHKSGTVALHWSHASCSASRRLQVSEDPVRGAAFYALPANSQIANTVPLYEYEDGAGNYLYSIDDALVAPGFTRVNTPIARVFENPIQVALPVAEFLGDLIADAGDDQCVSLAGSSTASVTLSAANSTAPADDPITAVHWRAYPNDECQLLEGESAEIALPSGTHAIELEITTQSGLISHDTVLVTVE